MLRLDNLGRVISMSYHVEDLHKEAKNNGLTNYVEHPFPHYLVSKKEMPKYISLYNIEKIRPAKLAAHGKKVKV